MKLSPEQLIQLSCVDFTEKCCPGVLLSASQNGMYVGKGPKVRAYIARQKRLGMLPGELDIMLTWSPKQILFIEIKAGKNDITDNQKEIMNIRRQQGFDCCVAWTLEDYVGYIRAYKVPIRMGMFYAGIGRL